MVKYIVTVNEYGVRIYADKEKALNYAAQLDTVHGDDIKVYEKEGINNKIIYHA